MNEITVRARLLDKVTSRMEFMILIIAVLATCGTYDAVTNFETSPGIDYYQFWGVCNAQNWSHGKLKSPYNELRQYNTVLDQYAYTSHDSRFRIANSVNHTLYKDGLDPTGTPFFYMLFTIMPQDFTLSYGIYQTAQIIFFIAAVVLLFYKSFRYKWPLLLMISIIILGYGPLLSDLQVGNVSSFQLFALAALTFFLNHVLARELVHYRVGATAAFMGSLVFLILLKPNLIIIALFLSASLLALQGTKIFISSAAIAALLGMILMGLTCVYFGSSKIWIDWIHYMSHIEKLYYPVLNGNYSTALIISSALNISVKNAIIAVISLLAMLALWVLFKTRNLAESLMSGLCNAVIRVLRDPFLCSAIGVILTLAVSPLVWLHYYVISLLPALWFLISSKRWGIIESCAMLSILLTSGIITEVLAAQRFAPYFIAFGWVPLWGCIMIRIADIRKISLS